MSLFFFRSFEACYLSLPFPSLFLLILFRRSYFHFFLYLLFSIIFFISSSFPFLPSRLHSCSFFLSFSFMSFYFMSNSIIQSFFPLYATLNFIFSFLSFFIISFFHAIFAHHSFFLSFFLSPHLFLLLPFLLSCYFFLFFVPYEHFAPRLFFLSFFLSFFRSFVRSFVRSPLLFVIFRFFHVFAFLFFFLQVVFTSRPFFSLFFFSSISLGFVFFLRDLSSFFYFVFFLIILSFSICYHLFTFHLFILLLFFFLLFSFMCFFLSLEVFFSFSSFPSYVLSYLFTPISITYFFSFHKTHHHFLSDSSRDPQVSSSAASGHFSARDLIHAAARHSCQRPAAFTRRLRHRRLLKERRVVVAPSRHRGLPYRRLVTSPPVSCVPTLPTSASIVRFELVRGRRSLNVAPSRRPHSHKRSVPPAWLRKLPTVLHCDQGSRTHKGREKNAQAVATASVSRGYETHHERLLRNVRNSAAIAKSRAIESLDRRRNRQSRDADATATAKAAETSLRRSVRNATTTARSGAAETFDRTRVHQFRDAAATATAMAAETQLRNSVRNARNAATTARSKAAETFDRRRARQSRDAAATARSRQRCSGHPAMPATLQRLLLLETPGPTDKGRQTFKGCYKHGRYYNLQAETRIGILPTSGRVPRRDVILLLQAMLHEVNSYSRSFKFALENAPFPSISLVIDAEKRPHDEHERRYTALACNEIAAIIHEEDGALRKISETHLSYDALQYPLLFPYGDDGYHFDIPLSYSGWPTYIFFQSLIVQGLLLIPVHV
ncbi:unnamed protein product [Acanthosepion pharaonis]|uniref:Uncharacterized protein n=1 Tax=Acanthosepion pharaonis TaxID=158019 RepID=A0A812C549_ACAPH|nr:unnamed protein product [Sepia pharaonis]